MQPPHKQPNTPAGPAAAAAAAACWSMLMGPVTLRSCVIVRADLITMMARLLWKMAAAVELVDTGGCWSAGVYDVYNMQEGSATYLLPVAARYMVDCLGMALYFSLLCSL